MFRATTGTATRLSVAVGANSGVTVEFWYSSRDRIRYTVTDPNGNVCRGSFCPNDPRLREYIARVYEALAATLLND